MSTYTDTPPTPADSKLREKHTADSVKYNQNHLMEHAAPIVDHLQGLKDVNPKKSKKLAGNVAQALQGIVDNINSFNK